MVEQEVNVPDTEATLAKTLQAVDKWEKAKTPAAAWSLANWLKAIWNPSMPVARLVFAAQLALIVLLAAIALVPRRVGPEYQTTSGHVTTRGGTQLTISFNPNSALEQVNTVLNLVGATVVSGPSAQGMYVIELPIAAEKQEEVQAAIKKLRSSEAVRFVELQP
jgi:hypothetical protein